MSLSPDAISTGGQAAASSRTENHVGFPNGISVEDWCLAPRCTHSAWGGRLSAACDVVGLQSDRGFQVVVLADGSQIRAGPSSSRRARATGGWRSTTWTDWKGPASRRAGD